MKQKILEKDVQRGILDYLRMKGYFVWKNSTVGIFKKDTGTYIPAGMRGVSDILGITKDGRFLAIEVKRPGGKMTEDQITFLNNIITRGGIGFCAHSIDDVIRELT